MSTLKIKIQVSLHEYTDKDRYGGEELVEATTTIALPIPDANAIGPLVQSQIDAILTAAGQRGLSSDNVTLAEAETGLPKAETDV